MSDLLKGDPRYDPLYVVMEHEIVQDGHEVRGKFFSTVEQAVNWMNANGECWGAQIRFQLFELGREIELEPADVVEPQPAKVKKGWKVKGG